MSASIIAVLVGFVLCAQQGGVARDARRLLDEEIAQLEDLVQTSPDGPSRAELLFRLGERILEKSRDIARREMEKYERRMAAWELERDLRPGLKEPTLDNRKSRGVGAEAQAIYRKLLVSHPDYPRADEVMFALASLFGDSGQRQDGAAGFRELIRKYPRSRLVPESFLALGEQAFQANDVQGARFAYERAYQASGSRVATYALYKLAWCDINLGEHRKALEKLRRVLALAREPGNAPAGEGRDRVQLTREALTDLARVYAHLDAPDEGFGTYQAELGKERSLPYLIKLGSALEAQGRNDSAILCYRRLLGEYPEAGEAPSFANALLLLLHKQNRRADLSGEAERALALLGSGSAWGRAHPPSSLLGQKAAALLEGTLRELACGFHREAEQTRQWETYDLARTLYERYLSVFERAALAGQVRWYLADLLYQTGDFARSAGQYAALIEADPAGAHAAEAAYDALLCWDHCLALRDRQGQDCREWKREKGATLLASRMDTSLALSFPGASRAAGPDPPGTPRSLPLLEQRWLEAADRLSRVAPGHDVLATVLARSIDLRARYGLLAEMGGRWRELVERHPLSPLTVKASRRALDAWYVRAGNESLPAAERTAAWKELGEWTARLLACAPVMGSPTATREGFVAELQSLSAEADYQLILARKESDPAGAAAGFVGFAAGHPQSRFAPRALFAALVSFGEARMLDRAIEAGERLLAGHPLSDRAVTARALLAGLYLQTAQYDMAARTHEAVFSCFRAHRARQESGPAEGEAEATEALFQAGLLREALGASEEALQHYGELVRGFSASRRAPEALLRLGALAERSKKWKELLGWLEGAGLRAAARLAPAERLVHEKRRSLALLRSGRGKEGLLALQHWLEAFGRAGEPGRSAELLAAAAEVRFVLLEAEFGGYVRIPLALPPRTLQKNLFRKLALRTELEKKYEEVIALKDPIFSLAALVRMGQLSQHLGEAMLRSPVPSGLTPEQQEIYLDELEKQAAPLGDRAKALLGKALQIAFEKGLYGPWELEAAETLQKLTPPRILSIYLAPWTPPSRPGAAGPGDRGRRG